MTENGDSGFTKLTAQCHCKQLTASYQIPNKELPVPIWLCQCDTCRKTSGLLCITSVHVPTGWKDLEVSGEPVRYRSSGGPSGLVRCFCGTCGAFVYEESEDPDRMGLSAGTLTQFEGLAKTGSLIFTSDTRDGGLTEWLPQLPQYPKFPGDQQHVYESIAPASAPSSDDRLHAACHCGGVEFYLTRPGPQSRLAYPRVNPCFEPDYQPSQAHPPESVHWYIKGQEANKFAAENCMCNSCRLCSGYDIHSLGFVPTVNVVQKDGSPMNFQSGTLKMYKSSPDVERYFCGKCGANVFFKRSDQMTEVSIGLLDDPSGARAEDWFVWTHLMSFHEDAPNRELFHALLEGLEKWRQRTGKSGADGPRSYK